MHTGAAGGGALNTQVTERPHHVVVRLSGEVDLSSSPQARAVILDWLGRGHHVLVDLSGVEYIDSSGLATLVEGYQLAKAKDLRFGLLSPNATVMDVLQLARLDQVFPLFDREDDFRTAPAG